MDKYIITEKELNYIETLYLYCDMQDFDNNKENHSTYSYYLQKEYLKETVIYKSKYIGNAKGRDWYQTENYRIGIMEHDKAKKANQYNCLIQYEQHYLYELDKELNNLDLPFGQELDKYKIKRIDVTKIAKSKNDYLTEYNFISQFKRSDRVDGTIYLGNRKNGCVFRIYNKTKELKTNTKEHPINYGKIELFSKYFEDIENLYTYELELHRSYLKECLGIETLADLEKVYIAYKNIAGQIRIYEDTDQNKKLIENNHRDRIKAYKLTEYETYQRVERKRYKTSFRYLIKTLKNHSDRYIDSMKLERNNEEYNKIIQALKDERITKFTPPFDKPNRNLRKCLF